MPHVVHLGRDVAIHPVLKPVRLSHVDDSLGAREKESTTDVGGNVAHELTAKARDLVVVEGGESSEKHGSECKVDNELVDHTCYEQGSGFAQAHKLHGRARIGGDGERVS